MNGIDTVLYCVVAGVRVHYDGNEG